MCVREGDNTVRQAVHGHDAHQSMTNTILPECWSTRLLLWLTCECDAYLCQQGKKSADKGVRLQIFWWQHNHFIRYIIRTLDERFCKYSQPPSARDYLLSDSAFCWLHALINLRLPNSDLRVSEHNYTIVSYMMMQGEDCHIKCTRCLTIIGKRKCYRGKYVTIFRRKTALCLLVSLLPENGWAIFLLQFSGHRTFQEASINKHLRSCRILELFVRHMWSKACVAFLCERAGNTGLLRQDFFYTPEFKPLFRLQLI